MTGSPAPFIVRVPALPATAAWPAESAPAASAVAAQIRDLRMVADCAAQCSELLHEVIRTAPPGRDRSGLLDLRRAIHSGRYMRVAKLAGKLEPLLPPHVGAEVRRWQETEARLRETAGQRAAGYAAELRRVVTAVTRAAAGTPAVTAELCRADSPLAALLERAGGEGTADLDSALSAYAMLARASVKTTPRGTLCGWAYGEWDSGPDRWVGDLRVRAHHVELNATVSEVILRQLAPGDHLVRNPSATFGAAYATRCPVTFLAPGHATVHTAHLDPPLRAVLADWPAEGCPVARARDRLGSDTILRRLTEAGLLVPRTEVTAHDLEPLRAVVAQGWAGPLAPALAEVSDLVDHSRQSPAAPTLHDRLSRLGQTMGWPQAALSDGAAVFGDTVVRGGRLVLGDGWVGVRDTLRSLGGWVAHGDPWASARIRAGELLTAAHGANTDIPLMPAIHTLARAAAAGDQVAVLFGTDYPLPDGTAPALRALRDLLQAEADAAGHDDVRLAGLPPAPAGTGGLTTALAFYGHPIRDDDGSPLFVLNSFEDGSGRADAHVRRLLRRIGVPDDERAHWPHGMPVPAPGTLDVEIDDVAGSNVNLRELGNLPALRLADERTGRAGPAARDCRVSCGPFGPALTFQGMRVRVVPRGRVAEFRYPPLVRLLSRLFGPRAEHRVQPVVAPAVPAAEPGVLLAPRVRIGDVVLLRRTVIVESTALPRRDPGEDLFGLAVRVDQWRRRCRIPRRSFVRAVGGPAVDKNRKPTPLDLSSPLGMAQFDRLTRRGTDRLLFHEVLPDARQVPADTGGYRWIPEVVWEVPIDAGH